MSWPWPFRVCVWWRGGGGVGGAGRGRGGGEGCWHSGSTKFLPFRWPHSQPQAFSWRQHKCPAQTIQEVSFVQGHLGALTGNRCEALNPLI